MEIYFEYLNRDQIVNGKFDKGGALKLMENTNSDNKVDQDKVKAILDACEKQGKIDIIMRILLFKTTDDENNCT